MIKKIQILTIMTLIVLGMTPQVRAASVDMVSFWMFDQPGLTGDGQITFQVSNIDYSGALTPAVLQYKTDNSSWQTVSSDIINITGKQAKLTFQIVPNNEEPITKSNLIYQGQDGIYYNGALMLWSGYGDISNVVMANKDKISPVPVPAVMWLFGSGLLGLLGIRRRIRS